MAEKSRVVIIVGVVAVAVAAIASYSLYKYLKGQEQKVTEAVASEQIVVASQEIPVGSAITALHVKTSNWPKASLPPGAFTSADQVTERIPIQTMMPGEPITEAKLMPKEGTGVFTYKIPDGHRAMTVGVDQVAGVAGFINPGNMVDVVLTTTLPGANMAVSKIVLQNVPCLAIGQIIENREGKAVVVPTVTMDVTPDDAEKLAIASSQGRLQLVLRRAGDKLIVKTGGATVGKVLSGYAPAVARSAVVRTSVKAPQVESVEIWR